MQEQLRRMFSRAEENRVSRFMIHVSVKMMIAAIGGERRTHGEQEVL
jgi:hypothetical protein